MNSSINPEVFKNQELSKCSGRSEDCKNLKKTPNARIVTIDGPAGAGKSTVAKKLASELGFDYLDTGSLYRAVALLGIRNQVDWAKPSDLVRLLQNNSIDYSCGRTLLNGEDVSDQVRSSEVTRYTKYPSENGEVRRTMNELQQKIAKTGRFVTEGRDQGSVVFPDALCKFYLTASPEERGRRRLLDLRQRGENASLDEIIKKINERDYRDATRDLAPLVQPQDAIVVDSDGKTAEEIVRSMKKIVLERWKKLNASTSDQSESR